jgi:hypothetical protein
VGLILDSSVLIAAERKSMTVAQMLKQILAAIIAEHNKRK